MVQKLNHLLITGANGFVGKVLCRYLLEKEFVVRAVVRTEQKKNDLLNALSSHSKSIDCLIQSDLQASPTDWSAALHGVDTVIHLASRVHMMQETSADPLAEYRKVNVAGTQALAEAAAAAGVRRFIYLSSIKVNGEFTHENQRFTELDPPNPQDPYGVSKWEAEQALHKISAATGMESVIIRPPLVYGEGVKANFQKLIRVVQKGWPLPLGGLDNSRSMVYVRNLVDAIMVCIHHEAARNQTFLVSDGDDVSTPQLIRRLANTFNRPTRLLSISPKLLRWIAKFTGKQNAVERLLSSLRIDNTKICNNLNWHPPYTMQEAFQQDFATLKK